MKRIQSSAVILTVATLLVGPAIANAASTTLTRAQVQAELAEAVRTGNILVDENGSRKNEFFPHNYESSSRSTLTRADVQAEIAAAQQAGNITNGENAERLNQLYPNNYSVTQNDQTKTRAEVQAEIAQARAQGLLNRYVGA